jgi:hypothetical protein
MSRMTGGSVADLVAKDPSELRLAIQHRQHSSGDVDVAAGQGHRVYFRDIDDLETIVETGWANPVEQSLTDRLHIRLQLLIAVAPKLPEDILIRLLADLVLLSFGYDGETIGASRGSESK